MAKRSASSGGVNVAAAIREYKASNPKAKPKAIAEGLASQNVNVSAGYVSTILSLDRKKKRKGRRAAGEVETTGARRGPKPAATRFQDFITDLQTAKQLVDKLGGLDKAQAALSALAKLQG